MSGRQVASSRVLRWLFRRGDRFVSLELSRGASDVYTLSLTPLGSESEGVETIDSGARAFERHGAVAAQLRQSGWKVVAFTAHRGPAPRPRPSHLEFIRL